MASFVQSPAGVSSFSTLQNGHVGHSSFLCRQTPPPVPPVQYTRAVLDTSQVSEPGVEVNSTLPTTAEDNFGPVQEGSDSDQDLSDSGDSVSCSDGSEIDDTIEAGFSDADGGEESPTAEEEVKPAVLIDDPLLFQDAGPWYTIESSISKPDTGGMGLPTPQGTEQVLDLMDVDSAGRQVLARSSYESVVDVDVELGGVLEDDEDNNELFSGVGLEALIESETILENLEKDFGIITATHVQLAAIPRVLERRDLVMQSYTGTGKTLAYLLPILDEMDTSVDITQAMVVAPTRELAMQISKECDRLVVNTKIRALPLIGGANPSRQVEKLRRMLPHIVVGTPGRLAEMAENGDLRVRKVVTLVVDEVDQCLVGEFGEQVQRLLQSVPRKTQKVLVSATGDVDSVRRFAGESLHKPILLRVQGSLRIPRNIEHWMCVVPGRLKIDTVRKLVYTKPVPDRAIVFVDDPRRVEIVSERLWQMRVPVGALRGNAYKVERKEVLDAFRKGKIQVLVSTEVAARGLDVPEMTHVINLDLPTDADHYVHRAGRCGRVGRAGHVISIASSENAFVMRRMSKEMEIDIRRMEPRDGEYREPVERTFERREKKAPVVGKESVGKQETVRRREKAPMQSTPRQSTPRQSTPRQSMPRQSTPGAKSGGMVGVETGSRDERRTVRRESAGKRDAVRDGEKMSAQSAPRARGTGTAGTSSALEKMDAKLEELRDALETGDEAYINEKIFAQEAEEEKERKEAQSKKAPKRSVVKAAKKAALKKKATRKKDRKRVEVSPDDRMASWLVKREKRNIRTRASLEGWVGNRPQQSEE